MTLVRTELLKLRTIRLPAGLLGAAAAMTALVSILTASRAGSGGQGPGGLVPALTTPEGLTAVIASTGFALLLALVFGVTVSSGEFRHGTATGTYLGTPGRDRVLVSKLLAAGVVGVVFGAVASVISTGVGLVFVVVQGFPVELSGASIAQFAGGAMLGAGLLAAAGVSLGSLIRQQLGAIIAVFAWAFVVEQIVGSLFNSIQPYLPYTAATTLAGSTLSGGTALPFAAAAGLVMAVAVALGWLATRTTVWRDVA